MTFPPVPSVVIQGVPFQRASSQPHGERDQRRVRALLFLGMAAWSGILAAYGQPVLGPVAALVWLELALASFRVAGATGSVTEDMALAERIAPMVTEIRARLGCAVPYVSVRDDTLRLAGVRRVRGQPVLILSRALAIRLGDAELRGIIAHELAHVVHGDLESARRKGLWASFLTLAVGLTIVALDADFFVIVAVPVWAAMWVVVSLAFVTALAATNRPLEMRADAVAAVLCNDPLVVASGLAQAAALARERHRAVYGAPPLSWLLLPVSWRVPSHPSIVHRTAHLHGMLAQPVPTHLLLPSSP